MPDRIPCPACSERATFTVIRVGTNDFPVYRCDGCSGLTRPQPILRQLADQLVGIDQPMLQEAEDATYFNLFVRDNPTAQPHRVHGWYSPSMRRVVQYG